MNSDRTDIEPAGSNPPSTQGITLKVFKGSFWGVLGQVLPMCVTLLATPFIVRLLGVEAYGALVLVNLIPAYLGFADFGMSLGSTKFAAEAYAVGDRDQEARTVRTAALIALLASLPIAISVVVFSSSVVLFLNIPEYLRSSANIAVKITAVSFVFGLLAGVLNTPELTRLRMELNLAVNATFRILGIVAGVAVLYLGFGLVGVVTVTACATLLTLLGHIAVSTRLLPELRGLGLDSGRLRPLLRFGGALLVSTIASLLLVNLEKLVLARVVSVKALAYYSVAFMVANLAAIFSASMTQSLLPAFAQLLRPGKEDELNRLFFRSIRLNLIVLFPCIVVMAALAKPFFTVWVGEEFGRESSLPFYILLAGLVFNLIAYIPNSLLVAAGRTDLLAKIYWIELAPYVALVILLASQYGIAGAAVAWSVRVIVDACVFITLAYRNAALRPPPLSATKYHLLLAMLFGGFPLILMYAFDNIYVTLTSSALFLFAYLYLVGQHFVTREEKLLLWRLIRRNESV